MWRKGGSLMPPKGAPGAGARVARAARAAGRPAASARRERRAAPPPPPPPPRPRRAPPARPRRRAAAPLRAALAAGAALLLAAAWLLLRRALPGGPPETRPFRAPLMKGLPEFNSAYKAEMLWGSYRAGMYFGMRTRWGYRGWWGRERRAQAGAGLGSGAVRLGPCRARTSGSERGRRPAPGWPHNTHTPHSSRAQDGAPADDGAGVV
jgi:hypothetical protein